MFVKLAVIACSLAFAAAASYNGPLAGGVPAAQFPAGVDPHACPNYPNCENPAVAVNQVPVQQYNTAPQYQAQPQAHYNPAPQQYNAIPQQYNPVPQQQYQPQYQPQYNPQAYNQAPVAKYSPNIQNALDRGEYIGDGDYHGEGLAEAGAPGYQAQPQAYQPAPVAYNQGAYNPGLPAGVQPVHQLPANVGQPAQIPAGVDPNSCRNYPFCS